MDDQLLGVLIGGALTLLGVVVSNWFTTRREERREARQRRRDLLEDARPPEEAISRGIALLEAAVDYVIMLAMRMQQAGGAKDKEALAQILDMLKRFEVVLQEMRAGKIDEMLRARIKADSSKDLSWMKWWLAIATAIVALLVLILMFLASLSDEEDGEDE